MLEETILILGKFHSCGAGFVVVRHAIDLRADGRKPGLRMSSCGQILLFNVILGRIK